MRVRQTASPPELLPQLLRHLTAYADLAGQDIARSRHELGVRLLVHVVIGYGIGGALAMSCLAVVAGTWDTPHRLQAIAGLAAVFATIAACGVALRFRNLRNHTPWLASVRREWRIDRVILERALANDRD